MSQHAIKFALKLVTASTVAVLSAACSSDAALGPSRSNGMPSVSGSGVSSPGTVVTATVTGAVAGQQVARATPRAPHEGTCNADGSWTHATGSGTNPWVTTGPWNGVCTDVTVGQYITVTFSELANYVAPPSGNINLNFADVCADANDPLTCVKRGVQYKQNSNETIGFGVLTSTSATMCTEPNGGGTCSDAGVWTIDLSELSGTDFNAFTLPHDGVSGWLIHSTSATYGTHPGYMAW